MLGKAVVAMWWDIAPELKDEFEDWHSHEHMPERLAIPGFLRGTRGPYLERLNDPSAWSRRMMPHHRDMVRSLCRVRASFGAGVAQAVATVRFALTQREAWDSDSLRELPRRRGMTGAHLFQSEPMENTATVEQKIRGGDREADGILLLAGYDVAAVEAAARELAPPQAVTGFYRLAYCLTSRDRA